MVRFGILTAQASSPKLEHSTGEASAEYLSAVIYLSPHKLSGRNLCPDASPGCIAACLNLAGRGGIFRSGEASNPIQRARLERSRRFLADRSAFVDDLAIDIGRLEASAHRIGKLPSVRLNGTSDVPWERVHGSDGRSLFERFPRVQFYDYTKSQARALESVQDQRAWPTNYVLSFSRSETTPHGWLRSYLAIGGRVSIVYSPESHGFHRARTWTNITLSPSAIVDGDSTDYRFLDAPGTVALLRAKGPAIRDRTGFVIRD